MTSKVTPSTSTALELYQRYEPIAAKHKSFDTNEDMVPTGSCLHDFYHPSLLPLELPFIMDWYGMSLLHVAVVRRRLNMVWELIQQAHPMDLLTTRSYSYGQIALPEGSTAYDYALKTNQTAYAVLLKLNGGVLSHALSSDTDCSEV